MFLHNTSIDEGSVVSTCVMSGQVSVMSGHVTAIGRTQPDHVMLLKTVTSKMERVLPASSNIGCVVVAWADNISHLGLQIEFRIILCVRKCPTLGVQYVKLRTM